MNGPGVSGDSIFSSQPAAADAGPSEGGTLSMLEQGAASYDGSVPMDEEGDTISVGSSQQSRAKANV